MSQRTPIIIPLLLILAALSLGSCSRRAAVRENLPIAEPTPGELKTGALGCWYLPSGYTPDRQWPLIVLLHPMGSSEISFFFAHEWTDQAEKRGYLLCAPKSRLTYWEDDGTDGTAVTNMILFMKKNFAVDDQRVCTFGFSSGGHFSHTMVLLNRDPDTGKKLINAWIAGSGGPGFQWDRRFRKKRVENRYRIPGFIFWGEREVPPPGKEIADFLTRQGWDITTVPHAGGHYMPKGYIEQAFDWFDALPAQNNKTPRTGDTIELNRSGSDTRISTGGKR